MAYSNLVSQTIRGIKKTIVQPGAKPITMKYGLGRGLKMVIDPAHKTQRIYGLDELEIATAIRKYALQAKTIVDIGANDGYYTLTLAILNPDAKVFSCEPEPEMRQKCLKNLELNGLKFDERITWVDKFIGLETSYDFISLDELLKSQATPLLLKIDIDGGELEALQSGENILKDKKCLLIVETHSKKLEEDCISFLSGLGYKCRIIPNAWWRVFIPEYRPIEHNRWFLASK